MNVISPTTKKILALSMLSGVGPATLRKVVSQGLMAASVDELSAKISPIARALAVPNAWEVAQELAEKQCDAAEKAEARIISPLDEVYPSLLAATKDDPFLLYVKGQLSITPEQSVAIIGTREPTKHGELITRRITEFFTERRWSVVSGLALGCDALAHRAAIESNGHTVAVLAHGLQTIAPSQHRNLAQQILDSGGALVSEYRFGQGALPTQFVKRDRTQAGLARGVVMIQSDVKGGSLHASRAALDYERWLAVPFPTDADKASNEPKVQANLLIADESADLERASLLKCHRSQLKRLIILRAKSDYSRMIEAACDGSAAQSRTTAEDVVSRNDALVINAQTEVGTKEAVSPGEFPSGSCEVNGDVSSPSSLDTQDLDLFGQPELRSDVALTMVGSDSVQQNAGQKPLHIESEASSSGALSSSKPRRKSKAKVKGTSERKKKLVKSELTVQQDLL